MQGLLVGQISPGVSSIAESTSVTRRKLLLLISITSLGVGIAIARSRLKTAKTLLQQEEKKVRGVTEENQELKAKIALDLIAAFQTAQHDLSQSIVENKRLSVALEEERGKLEEVTADKEELTFLIAKAKTEMEKVVTKNKTSKSRVLATKKKL